MQLEETTRQGDVDTKEDSALCMYFYIFVGISNLMMFMFKALD